MPTVLLLLLLLFFFFLLLQPSIIQVSIDKHHLHPQNPEENQAVWKTRIMNMTMSRLDLVQLNDAM